MKKRLDEEAFIKFLQDRGGSIYSSRSGIVPSKLANILGVAPNAVSQFLRRMERLGVVVVDRGPGGRFIYGVRLVTPPKEDAMYPSVWQGTIKSGYMSASDQLVVNQPNATISLAAPDLEDYSGLAAKLLEKAVDAIVENERLKERIAYLEGKIAEQPLTLDERRRNVVKDLLQQVGEEHSV